jgi:hypothetical protein
LGAEEAVVGYDNRNSVTLKLYQRPYFIWGCRLADFQVVDNTESSGN